MIPVPKKRKCVEGPSNADDVANGFEGGKMVQQKRGSVGRSRGTCLEVERVTGKRGTLKKVKTEGSAG